MPLPKKKVSRRHRGGRRAHDGLTAPAVASCPNCGAVKAPHRVCGECGYYKEKQVIETEDF